MTDGPPESERIESWLIRKLLKGKVWLDYLPEPRGQAYRKLR